MKLLKPFLLLTICLFFFGCAYKVAPPVSPAVNIYSSYEGKIPGTFVLIMDEDIKNINKEVKPSSYVCSAHKYPVEVDQSLALSIRNTSEAIFEEIIEQKTMPTKSQLAQLNAQGVIFLRLKRFYPRISFAQGFWTVTANGSCDLVLEILVRDRNNRKLLVTTVGGNAAFEGDAGGACGGGATVLNEAIYLTIRDAMERYAERVSNCKAIRDSCKPQPRASYKQR